MFCFSPGKLFEKSYLSVRNPAYPVFSTFDTWKHSCECQCVIFFITNFGSWSVTELSVHNRNKSNCHYIVYYICFNKVNASTPAYIITDQMKTIYMCSLWLARCFEIENKLCWKDCNEALPAARSVDDWWEDQSPLLFICLPANNHDCWSITSRYFLQVWRYETLISIQS